MNAFLRAGMRTYGEDKGTVTQVTLAAVGSSPEYAAVRTGCSD